MKKVGKIYNFCSFFGLWFLFGFKTFVLVFGVLCISCVFLFPLVYVYFLCVLLFILVHIDICYFLRAVISIDAIITIQALTSAFMYSCANARLGSSLVFLIFYSCAGLFLLELLFVSLCESFVLEKIFCIR